MSKQRSGNVLPEIFRDVMQELAKALRVIPVGFDGSDYPEIKVEADGTVHVTGSLSTSPSGTQDVNIVGSTETLNTAITNTVTAVVSGSVDVDNFPANQPVSQLGAPWEVFGQVTIGNFPATQVVSGTVDVGNFPALQQVFGQVTIGNFPASQTVDGTVNVGNFPAIQPISGQVTIGNFPAVQAVSQSGAPWEVFGAVTIPNTVQVQGPAASDAAAAGNPVLLGVKGRNSLTQVDNNDVVEVAADQLGRQIIMGGGPGTNTMATYTLTGSGTVTLLGAQGAGTAILIQSAFISAGTADDLLFEFRIVNDVVFSGYPANTGGGFAPPLPEEGWQLPINTGLSAKLDSAPGDKSVRVNLLYKVLD